MDGNIRTDLNDSVDSPLSHDNNTISTLAGDSQSAEFSETTDLNQASSSQSVSNDDCTGKNVLFNEQGESGFSWPSTDVTCPSTDEERPRTFSELRKIFSQENNGQVSRPDSRDLDLTPVKENQNVDYKPDKPEEIDFDTLLLSGLESNFEARSKHIDTPGNLRTNKSISFGIDLDNCVTRDCESRDMRYNESLENGKQCNGSSEYAPVDNVVKDISETFKKQEDTFVEGSVIDVPKKSQSWDISLDDENITNQQSKRRMLDKKFSAKLKKSSPEQAVSSKNVVADQAVTSSSKVSPRSFSFEITFENRDRDIYPSNKKQRCTNKVSAKNQSQRSKASRDRMRLDETCTDSLQEKDLKNRQAESLTGKTIVSQSSNESHRETSTASNNNFSDSETNARDQSLDAFPAKEGNEGISNLSTCGISFDISFGDGSPFPKTRLAPKHIRLKMVKTNRTKSQKKATNNVESKKDEKEKLLLAKRDTYTLDEVSQTLQKAGEKGQTLEEALDDLSRSHNEQNNEDTLKPMDTDESDAKLSKRGTYSLDEVSKCLVDAATNGQTVTQASDCLAHSEERNKSANNVKHDVDPKRGTYDLNDVSEAIDSSKSNGNSLEQALEQLLGEVESAVRTPPTVPQVNRGTYDLEDVSVAVDNLSELGVPAEESLSKISNHLTTKSTSTQAKKSTTNQEFIGNESSSDKRGTYSLDDIEKRLDSVSDSPTSVIDTLNDISKNGFEDSGKECSARHTYTLDEVAQSLEIAKTKGIPVVEALSSISNTDSYSTPGSRRTYSLDEVAESLESARSKGLPIVMALENLVITHGGGSLRAPAEVAVHRRQGKLTNRKTYALASPLETIGEDNQLRLFDGASRKLLPSVKDPVYSLQSQIKDGKEIEPPSGTHVMQTLDLLTSACEALLKSPPRPTNTGFEEQSQDNSVIDSDIKSEGSERRTYSLDDVSENLKTAEDKGIPVVEALESLAPVPTKKHFRIPRAIRKASSKSDSNLHMSNAKEESSRQTYSLESVSNSVEAAKAKGIPVIAALDELTESLARFSATGAQLLKHGKKPIKKPDRPSIRKREAARLERSGVRSEVNIDIQRETGTIFPISYPPAMRNSYSLDDVASAFEMAYKTGASFQEFLDDKTKSSQQVTGNKPAKASGSAFKAEAQAYNRDGQEQFVKSNSATSLSRNNDSEDTVDLHLSSSDSQIVPDQRKDSFSSEGSLSCSSSAGSDFSLTKGSSSESTEDIRGGSSIRKLRKGTNGPFQLRRSRRNLQKQKGASPLSQENLKPSKGSLEKRGTYELKKVSEDLDRLKDQGIPIVKSLDTIAPTVSDSSTLKDASNFQDEKRIKEQLMVKELNLHNKENESKDISNVSNVTDNSSSQQPDFVSNLLQNDNSLESIPKRSTYIAEDDTKLLGSTSHESIDVHGGRSELSDSSSNESRNTFKLDHVQHSIEDAHKRGVPVVDVLDKLSNVEVNKDKERRKHFKTKLKSFVKPQTKSKDQNEFFIEYFPSKKEDKSPKFKLENDKAVNESGNLECVESEHQSEITSKQDSDSNANQCIQNNAFELPVQKDFGDKACAPGSAGNNNETESVVNEEQSNLPPSKPRWQRTGSYVEALDSYQKIVDSPEGNTKEPENSTPVKDNGNEEQATSRSRPTWRTSESVLGQILSLMDNAEERGLSIADALEQAAEMSEKEGLFYGKRSNLK